MAAARAPMEDEARRLEHLARPVADMAGAVALIEVLVRSSPRSNAIRERVGLRPMHYLLEALGAPQDGLSCVHVAGSKGKGSTVLLAEAVLRAAGRTVGTYTSPHLARWNERIRIDGDPVEDACFAWAAEQIRAPLLEAWRAEPDLAPGFFDALTAMALVLFRRHGVEVALLETGLGGRLDATNAVRPLVTCITSIEREHTERLGTTLARIATEKAGILKPGVPVVQGRLPRAAVAVVEARARELGVARIRVGHELRVLGRGGGRILELRGRHRLRLALPPGLAHAPPHTVANAAMAFACVAELGVVESGALLEAASTAWSHPVLPGRCELRPGPPWILIDGSHTRVSTRALAQWLPSVWSGERHLLVSLARDKDPKQVLGPLLAGVTSITVTTADAQRSRPAAELAATLREIAGGGPVDVVAEPAMALGRALDALPTNALLCIAGSMYLAGYARRHLDEGIEGQYAGGGDGPRPASLAAVMTPAPGANLQPTAAVTPNSRAASSSQAKA